jgi:hypothetical protein
VAREMESRTRRAGMESFPKMEVAERGELCAVHFSLQGFSVTSACIRRVPPHESGNDVS